MSKLIDSLRRASSDLEDHGARFAIIGGLAVSVRTEPRTTRDADFAVAVTSDSEAETIVGGLIRSGYEVAAGIEQMDTGRLATMRLWPPGERASVAVVDLLFASSGIEPEVVDAADALVVADGFRARVATIGHLIALKLLARDDRRRPQDRIDLAALFRFADPEELERAKHAIALIHQRGFARGRDLARALADARSELGGE